MKSVLILAFMFASVLCYPKAQKQCIVQGKLSGGSGTVTIYPYQECKTAAEAAKLMIKAPINNGRFKVVLDDELAMRQFVFDNDKERKQISIFTGPYSISVGEVDGAIVVKGSPAHEEYEMICKELRYSKFDSLSHVREKSDDDKAFEEQYRKQLFDAIVKYPKSIPLSYLVYREFWSYEYNRLNEIISRFDASVYSSYYLKQLIKRRDILKRVEIGESAADFTLPDKEGKSFSLSSFRGNFVLLDFWASWCGPCRKEIPNLKKIHDAFRDKNFKIISVSIDEQKKPWLVALNKEKMGWLQLHDKDFSASSSYGIISIPQVFLISPEGTILAKNLHGEQIWEVLNSILK